MMKDEFIVKKSSTQKLPNLLNYLLKISKQISNNTLSRSTASLRRKHHFLFSLAHKIDRMDRCEKYIDAWVTAVGMIQIMIGLNWIT